MYSWDVRTEAVKLGGYDASSPGEFLEIPGQYHHQQGVRGYLLAKFLVSELHVLFLVLTADILVFIPY